MYKGEVNSGRRAEQTSGRSVGARTQRGRLVVNLVNGLGNRLTGLLASLVVAESVDLDLTICWLRDPSHCDAEFTHLFEPDELKGVEVLRELPPHARWKHYDELTKAMIIEHASRGAVLFVEAFNLYGEKIVGHYSFYEGVRAQTERLRPVRPVRELLARLSHCDVGIHVRMTDHLPSRAITPRWCYREAAATLLRLHPDVTIFVCSDTPEFIEGMRALDPVRIRATPRVDLGTAPRSALPAVQLALAEILALSQCSLIIGAPASSFALVAGVLRGSKFVRLAAWPRPICWRFEKLLWPIYRAIVFDLKDQRWHWRRTRGFWFAPFSLGGLFIARVFCSPIYQDHALPFQRRWLRKRFAGLRDAPVS